MREWQGHVPLDLVAPFTRGQHKDAPAVLRAIADQDGKYRVGPDKSTTKPWSLEEIVLDWLRLKDWGMRLSGEGQFNHRKANEIYINHIPTDA